MDEKKLEKLIATIIKECEADGEPVTYEEAKEMAEMELKANKDCKTYAQSTTERKKVVREHKVDEAKKSLITAIAECLADTDVSDITVKNEAEISFKRGTDSYTVKLIKHRPPKKQAVACGSSLVGKAHDF